MFVLKRFMIIIPVTEFSNSSNICIIYQNLKQVKPFVCDILLGFNYKLGLFHSIVANIFEKSIHNQKEL